MKNIYIISLVLLALLSITIVLINDDVLLDIKDNVYKDPTHLSIREVDVKPVNVTSSFVDINITTYINHIGGQTNDASVLIRAIDSSTGLLNSQVSVAIPETFQESTEKTLITRQNLKIEKSGNYNLKILLFNNGSVLDSGSIDIRGINILVPQSKRNGITMSNMDFIIGGTSAGKVIIKPDIYLENIGSETSDNLRVLVKARESDSNILADKTEIETGPIKSEATAIKEVQLSVPDEYNYMIVVETWKDDTMINSWERPILLAPTKTIPKGSLENKVNIEVSKFAREGTPSVVGTPSPNMYATTATQPYSQRAPQEPGFEIVGSIAVMLIVSICRRRL
jgi:hypothetical protein